MESRLNVRTIEFFSGIGGWSCALENLRTQGIFDSNVVCAIDINETANDVYEHNFRRKAVTKSVESIANKFLDSQRADLWVMSPPCQPFTRNNETNTRDQSDPRTRALMHIINSLGKLRFPPRFLALENVVGFEKSYCCQSLLEVLALERYSVMQFILTPTQFGIPNDRPRYYLLAARDSRFTLNSMESGFPETSRLQTCIPRSVDRALLPLSRFIEDAMDGDQQAQFHVSESILEKTASWCLDIVRCTDHATACFTKSYGRYLKGTGSVLLVEKTKSSQISHSATVSNEADLSSPGQPQRLDSGNSSTGKNIEIDSIIKSSTGAVTTTCEKYEFDANPFRNDPSQRQYEADWYATCH